MTIKYGDITVVKITRNVFQATTNTTEPLKAEVTMTGHTPEIAKQKLILFLENKPYKHLDQNGSK